MPRILIVAAMLACGGAQAHQCQYIDPNPKCWDQDRAVNAAEESARQLEAIAEQLRQLNSAQPPVMLDGGR